MTAWGEQLVTVAEAAEYAGVAPATVRSWAHRDRLQLVRRDRRGRALYRLADVAAAERAARTAPSGRPRRADVGTSCPNA